MTTEEELRDAMEWVDEVERGRFVGLVFEHAGKLEPHYQVGSELYHYPKNVPEDRVDRFHEIRKDHRMHIAKSGEAIDGEYYTIRGRKADFEENVRIVHEMLADVYDVTLDDVVELHRAWPAPVQ